MRKLLPALILIAACGSGSTEVKLAPSEIGVYSLRSVNGDSLPVWTWCGWMTCLGIGSGELTLAAGGVVYATTGTYPGTSTFTDTGHYTRRGDSLSFTYHGHVESHGAIYRDTFIVVVNDGRSWLYVRH